MKQRFSFYLGCGMLLLTVLACGKLRSLNAERESTPTFELSADDLAKEFKQDLAAAGRKYTGETLAITGRVDEILSGSSLVFEGYHRHGFVTQCNLDKSTSDQAKGIRIGTEVTVIGVVMGMKKNDGPLIIKDCIMR